MSEEIESIPGISGAYNNIGAVYFRQGDSARSKNNFKLSEDKYKNALKYYQLSILTEPENKKLKAGISLDIGNVLLEQKKYAEAATNLNLGLKLFKELEDKEGLILTYNALSSLDSARNDFRSALEHYKLHVLYEDSIMNEDNTKKIVQSQMQFEFDKKAVADSIKNSESRKFEEIKYQEEISKQRIFTYGGIAGFLVMIIVAGISYRAFRNKRKATILIQHQKALVEEKQKEILDSIRYAKRIQTALLTSEKYIQRVLNR